MVSVIVPVYKTEEYLNFCVQSVCAQTYENWEMLLVDDGSPDACPKLCDAWATREPRIRVIHKKNGGLSDARNAGIKAARGQYLFFLDSDDWIEPYALATLTRKIEIDQSDLVICGLKQYSAEGARLPDEENVLPAGLFSNREALGLFRMNSVALVSSCSKLYRRNVFDTFFFPTGKTHEDELTAHFIVEKSQSVSIIHDLLYCYRKNPAGIMHNRTFLKSAPMLLAFEERIRLLNKYELSEAVFNQTLNYFNTLKCFYPNLAIGSAEERVCAHEILKRYCALYPLITGEIGRQGIRNRAISLMLRYLPRLYAQAYCFLMNKKDESVYG